MTGRVLAWSAAFLLLATSALRAATVSGTTPYTLTPVSNTSTKVLNYKATQTWVSSGVSTNLVSLPIGSPGLVAGDYEVSFDFMMSDPPDALVVNLEGDNAGDGNNFQRTVINPGKLTTWQHATAVYTIAGADAWTGTVDLYVKFNADSLAGTTDSFLVHFDNIVVRRVSDNTVIKSVTFEGDAVGSAPSSSVTEVHRTSGNLILAIDMFKVGYTPQPLAQTDFNAATVKSYINNEVMNSGTPTIDDFTARISASASQVAQVVTVLGSNRALQFTDNGTDTGGARAFKSISGVSSGSTGYNEVTVMFDVTALPLTGDRPTLQVSLNSGGNELASSAVSALHLKFKEAGSSIKMQYYNFDGSEHSNFLDIGVTYRVHIVLNLSNPGKDVQSLRVAKVNDLTHPVLEVTDVLTRAANVVPNMLVFDAGIDGAALNASPFIQVDNVNVYAATYAPPKATPIPSNTLWQIGAEDSSAAEFSTTGISAYTIPSDWATRTDWTAFTPRIQRTTSGSTIDITYSLASVPTNGVEFDFRSKYSSYTTPELAVYSNGQFAGQIQVWGTKYGQICVGDFRQVYKLYIPPEKLQTGTNTLRLEVPPGPFPTASTAEQYYLVGWDYLRLRQLTAAATEPTHGRVVYAGTIIMQNASQTVNQNTVRFTQPTLEWLGIAYSGNTMRANFWKNRDGQQLQADRLAVLQKFRDLNMTVVMDWMSGSHAGALNGTDLNASDQAAFSTFLSTYGSLFQYYEVANEPAGIGGEPLDKLVAIAKWLQTNKPSHMKVAAPGYSFPSTGGTPDGWETNPYYRLQIEQYCDLMGGHAYGNSYQIPQGGQFMENMDSYGYILNDGFPKPVIVTEHGSVASHSDLNDMGSGQYTDSATFDRNMRSMIAATDRFLYHAPWFNQAPTTDCHLLMPISNWATDDPYAMQERPGYTDTGITQESRLKTYRRLALAYATHGSPLKYTVTNAAALANKRVYVRPVNTATLAALPGSGGTSNKVLLNFVNFESTQQTVTVRIWLPASGNWTGHRIGPGSPLSTARTAASFTALPYVDITETLNEHESVQFILTPP